MSTQHTPDEFDNPHLQTVWEALHVYREAVIPEQIAGETIAVNNEDCDDICHAMACIRNDLELCERQDELFDIVEDACQFLDRIHGEAKAAELRQRAAKVRGES